MQNFERLFEKPFCNVVVMRYRYIDVITNNMPCKQTVKSHQCSDANLKDGVSCVLLYTDKQVLSNEGIR